MRKLVLQRYEVGRRLIHHMWPCNKCADVVRLRSEDQGGKGGAWLWMWCVSVWFACPVAGPRFLNKIGHQKRGGPGIQPLRSHIQAHRSLREG